MKTFIANEKCGRAHALPKPFAFAGLFVHPVLRAMMKSADHLHRRAGMSAPHSHSEDRIVAVIKGTWYTGTDDAWDVEATKGMSPGSYMIHPANAVHFDGARDEEVIVQITGMGPVKTVHTAPAEGGFGKPHKLK